MKPFHSRAFSPDQTLEAAGQRHRQQVQPHCLAAGGGLNFSLSLWKTPDPGHLSAKLADALVSV